MTHKPGHKTHHEYDKLSPEAKKRFDNAMKPDFWESKQGDGAAK